MTRDYLSYWRSDTIDQLPKPFLLNHGASNQYDRVSTGDTVWIVTVRNGDLRLVGNILVDLVTTYDEARIILNTDSLWPAKYHIISTQENAMTSCDLSLSDIVGELRFDHEDDRLHPENGLIDAQQVRVMRPLTTESGALLRARLDQYNFRTFFGMLVNGSDSDGSGNDESNANELKLSDDSKNEIVSALNLLYQYLDLRMMVPDLSHWNEKRLGDNVPVLVRLQRLMSMFRAFQISWDPSEFSQGNFIDPRQDKYAPLLRKLINSTPEIQRHGLRVRADQMAGCFNVLLSYRINVEKVLSFNSRLLEANWLYLTALNKTSRLNNAIRQNLSVIDEILAEFICPDQREFTVENLIRDYEYPDVDLFMLDAGCW
jgi:hypothetical protein